MNDEDIEKVARKVLELQKQEGVKAVKNPNTISDVINKYHREVYDKFGATGMIDSAIRTVVVYSQGQRYISRLNSVELDKAKEFAEFLYKKILGKENM